MNRTARLSLLAGLALSGSLLGLACNPQTVGAALDFSGLGEDGATPPQPMVDLSFPPGTDLAGDDLSAPGAITACGDTDPGCTHSSFGPPQHPFPLQSDPQPDPNETDNGVDRDMNGWLGLSSSHSNFDFLWLANTDDWSVGSVSKVNSKSVKEVARYFTVTCYSNPGGSRANCDGANGCCSLDDFAAFQNRQKGQPSGPHQAIQATANLPSRTAVDFNGDVWVANRAFGGQSSLSKIANDPVECVDRNGTPGIQTSSDVNGDGVIDTDCNRNGIPDDIADVQKAPCKNGKAQEFYGFDDECVLFTTNTNTTNKWGRPLALGQGSVDFGPSDAWAGSYMDGMFFRIDGKTGMTKAQTQVPLFQGSGPYGAAIDASGIAWVTELGAGLTFFDTGTPAMTGKVRDASGFSVSGYGITLDRDQNVWTGGWGNGHANRYTPDRSNGFAKLNQGYWTLVNTPGSAAGATGSGRGVAADSRTPQSYFVWMARDGGWVSRIDASTIPVPNGADKQVDGSKMPAMPVAGSGNTIGAGVDTDQNIWGISLSGSVATRIKVDNAGNMTMPDINGGQNNAGCPVGGGDRCTLGLGGVPTNPDPYTYSDFTGFGLRNFTNPKGYYSYIQKGCMQGDTSWAKIAWDADVPASTKITVRARSGPSPVPDNTWGGWTTDYATSPANLRTNPLLMPNPANYIQVEFDFTTMDKTATARLKDFQILYVCLNKIG